MSELTIRPAEDGDIPGILDTLRAALGETPLLRRTRELWAWKHTLNPFGPSLVYVADAGGRIAGVRAMMRWQLLIPGGGLASCLRPVDTATHPEFERQGIFRRLTTTVLDVARAEGVHLVFNTPNDKSAQGYVSMGWGEVGPIGVLVRPRLGRAVKPEPDRPPNIGTWAPGAQPFPEATLPADRPPRGLRTPRSTEYLTWRFRSHPTASYGWIPTNGGGGLVARAGARSGRSELVVSDLLGSPTARVIGSAARASRVRYLAGWFSSRAPERSIAVRGGMLPLPGATTLRLHALPLSDLPLDVHDLGSWDLSTSDLELL
jgi:GNAT superfamily N-acetyltransferase